MTPASRIQLAITLLDAYDPHKGPLASYLKDQFKTHRFAGSKDRRFITDLVYKAVRLAAAYFNRHNIEQWCQNSGRMLVLFTLAQSEKDLIATTFTGEAYAPTRLTPQETSLIESDFFSEPLKPHELFPKWLYDQLYVSCDEMDLDALSGDAPVDIRCIKNRDTISAILTTEGIDHVLTPYAPTGIRLKTKLNLTQHDLFKAGHIDIQDESSQILAALIPVKKKDHILDLCAGGGGKSLALAALTPSLKITATDIDPKRLDPIHNRAKQQRFSSITTADYYECLTKENQFDVVLIDAPCTGSGTLRRFPEKKYVITESYVKSFQTLQRDLLDISQRLVKPGGVLVYATCSLLAQENEAQVNSFLKRHSVFSLYDLCDSLEKINLNSGVHPGTYLLRPRHHETDGFFTAIFKKESANS